MFRFEWNKNCFIEGKKNVQFDCDRETEREQDVSNVLFCKFVYCKCLVRAVVRSISSSSSNRISFGSVNFLNENSENEVTKIKKRKFQDENEQKV